MAKQNLANSVANDLFKTIDLLASQQINRLEFDKTMICTITKNNEAKKGIYTVSDGSIEFIAYSEDVNYKVNTKVYVKIPNGDMANQKIITSKYIDENSEYIDYIAPLDSFIDISGNLIDESSTVSLRANSPITNKLLWECFDQSFKGYSKLGLKANFKTLLPNSIKSGNYGVKLDITEITRAGSSKNHSYVLDSSNMFGNPYNFTSFYSQEILLDISNLYEITEIRLSFYQSSNFILSSGNFMEANVLYDDLFIEHPYISLGYGVESFTEDKVILESPSAITYNSENQDQDRQLKMRWVHKKGDKFYPIDELEELPEDCTIHWYRYSVEVDSKDPLAGYFWKEFYPDNIFNYTFTPDYTKESDSFKVIIEYPNRTSITESLTSNSEIKAILEKIKATDPEKAEIIKLCDLEDASEASKLYTALRAQHIDNSEILSYLGDIYSIVIDARASTVYYESDIFKFDNEISQSDELLDMIQALTIEVDKDGYQGNYRLYDNNNFLVNSGDSLKLRTLKAVFNSSVTLETELQTAEEIIWYMPTQNTMIAKPVDGKEYRSENGDLFYSERESDKAGYAMIKRYGVDSSSDSLEEGMQLIDPIQFFRIKDYFESNAINNTIYCKLKKRGRVYESSVPLHFGFSGNVEAQATLKLNLYSVEGSTPINALTLGSSAIVVPKVYDYNNKLIESFEGLEVTYEWLNSSNSKAKIDAGTGVIDTTGCLNMSDACFLIAKCTFKFTNKGGGIPGVPYGKQVTLIGYLPIAVQSVNNNFYIQGSDKIIYNIEGNNPSYYKEPYTLYNNNDQALDVNWFGCAEEGIDISDEKELLKINKFYPQVDITGCIVPTAFYYSNLSIFSLYAVNKSNYNGSEGNKGLINKSIFVQPILITQSKPWLSSVLQSWDGSLTIDEKNGTILSMIMGAGIKEANNSFSGVLMGNVEGVENATDEKIGIYGYHQGSQSFGFKVDGTAFIGSGSSQITFNGTTGKITGNEIEGSQIKGSTFYNNNGTFEVTEKGLVICNDIIITGGKMGIGIGNDISIGAGSQTTVGTKPQYFQVTSEGTLSCKGANIAGNVIINGGSIRILESEDSTIQFIVTDKGQLTCKGATIEGNMTIKGGSISIKNDEAKTSFEVDEDGNLTCNSVNITGGSISIKKSDNTTSFEVDENGNLICNSVNITGGQIKINSGEDDSLLSFWLQTSGKLECKGADIEGNVVIKSGSITIEKSDGTTSFKVDNDGKLTCIGADITGNVKVLGGSISIESEGVDDNGNKVTYFNVDSTGVLNCRGATVEGNVKVLGGSISIESTTKATGPDGKPTDDPLTFFKVTSEGIMDIKGGSIFIESSDKEIAKVEGEEIYYEPKTYFKVDSNGVISIKGGSISIVGTKGETNTYFKVDQDGKITCNALTINGGQIEIKQNNSDNIDTDTDRPLFSVSQTGELKCKKATIKQATISNATITNGKISKATIEAQGNVNCTGLTIGKRTYSPYTFNAQFATIPYAADVLTEYVTLNCDTYEDDTGGPSLIGCSFNLQANTVTGEVTGDITIPKHTHKYHRPKTTITKDYTNYGKVPLSVKTIEVDLLGAN